jgi:glyoxylase-like metal-dependent hydrolase (beta-lactamase superfamily II)
VLNQCTHAHPDHLGSAKHLSGGTTPISLHPASGDIARAGIIHQTMKAGPGLLTGILFRLFIPKKPTDAAALLDKAIVGCPKTTSKRSRPSAALDSLSGQIQRSNHCST